MSLTILILFWKDGKQKFAFNVNKDNLIGPGQDGRKGLLVMMHKEGEAPQPKPNPVEMSLWGCGGDFPGDIDVKGQIGCYKIQKTMTSIYCVLFLMINIPGNVS